MSVYVDEMSVSLISKKWPYNRACHMIADNIEELHSLASVIGLKRSWFQKKTIPHYDLTENKRRQAVKAGAIPIDMQEFVRRMREARSEMSNKS